MPTDTFPPNSIIFVHDYPPLIGGGLVVNTWNIAQNLADSGWKTAIASPEVEKEQEKNSVILLRIDDLNQFRSTINKYRTLVINLNFSMRPGALGALQICQAINQPYYIWFRTTLKNLFFYRYATQTRFEQETRLEDLKRLLNNSLCVKVICVSAAVKSDLTRLGVLEEKLQVIRDGVLANKSILDQSSTLKGEEGDLVFTGRLSLEKGPRYLIDATKILKRNYPNIRVSIAGQGPEEDYLQTMVKVLGLEKNVKFFGHLPNGEVLDFVKKHKVYCCSSLTESFGLSVVEAILCGVPVVAPKIEGPQEILQNSQYGLLFELGNTKDLADKINSVLSHPHEAAQKAQRAKDYAIKEFSLKRQLGELKDLITNNQTFNNQSLSNLSLLSTTKE